LNIAHSSQTAPAGRPTTGRRKRPPHLCSARFPVRRWRLAARIEKLADNPRPSGCKKLKGGVNEWRIGDYRVIYMIEDHSKTVDVTRIGHRKEAYKP
jgi:mRNA interferase RelE/StbE